MNFTPFQSGGSGGGGLTAAAAQTLIDAALDALGDQLLDSVDDYANAPTVDSDGNAPTDGDKFYLAQDTIGTGTAASPEYPTGLYRYDGTEWVFHKKLGAGGKFLTPVFLTLTAAQNYVMLPDHWYGIQSTADDSATMQVPLMAQNECIEINSAATEDVTLTYIAGVTTHGAPNNTIKPTYYASVIARNANLVEVVGLEESTGATSGTSEPLPKLSIQLGTEWNNVPANNAYQKIQFTGTPWIDTESGWDDANDQYVVGIAGKYDAILNLIYQNNGNTSNDPCEVHIRVNGADTDLVGTHDISDQINGTSGMSFQLRGVLDLNVGDIVTCETFDQDDIISTQAGSTFELTKSEVPSVINANDIPVDDQATSGYIDIGTMRMQWGVTDGSTSITTVTFPQPFANTDYSITATPNESGGYSATAHTKTTTSALVHARVNTTNGNAAIITSWQAIGLKP